MGLDLVALVLLAIFAWLGARRGALASGLSLAGLVVGYAVSLLAARPLGGVTADAIGVSPFFGVPIAGMLVFVAVSFAFWLLAVVLRRRGDGALSPASRIGGACFGVLRGSLVVLLLGLLSIWVEALPQIATGAADVAVADDASPLRNATRAALHAGVEATLGSDTPGADLAARALANPAESIAQLRGLAESPDLAALADDHAFWSYVEADAVPAALAQPSFQRIQANTELRRRFAALGVVDAGAAGDPAIFAREVRTALEQIGPRLRELREDPDLARLASDPAIAVLVQRRDVVGLLANPSFQHVLSKALAAPSGSG